MHYSLQYNWIGSIVEYVCFGFCSVDRGDPSPKSHDQDAGSPVDVSVNATTSGRYPVVGLLVKLATGIVG